VRRIQERVKGLVDFWALPFITNLPAGLDQHRLDELDTTFRLTETRNAEVAQAWLLLAIREQYAVDDSRLAAYLTEMIGRRKLVWPLYKALVASPEGRARSPSTGRPGHGITQSRQEW